jgi:hypothetical protein
VANRGPVTYSSESYAQSRGFRLVNRRKKVQVFVLNMGQVELFVFQYPDTANSAHVVLRWPINGESASWREPFTFAMAIC